MRRLFTLGLLTAILFLKQCVQKVKHKSTQGGIHVLCVEVKMINQLELY